MRRSIRSVPRGFTLLEVLIATAITLLMMLSLLQVFKVVGDSMKQGRAALQMNNSLRSVTFRLRQDLNNLTIRVDPPADASTGAGYLEYFDGSMTDYTATLFDPKNGSEPDITTSAVRSSRFGDMDDILMFTARAGDSWFVGQVPEYIVNSAGGSNPVSITSQLAEIVVFARPVNTSSSASVYFDDNDGNFMPDAYQLYYRALLIRPDLNTDTTSDPPALYGITVGTANQIAAPLDMAPAYQLCDLSMRRLYNGDTALDKVAANSLEDLMEPANRFAHFQYAIPSTVSTTMPLLVLQPIPRAAMPVFADDGNASTKSPLYSDPDPSAYTAGPLAPLAGSAGNFLHPSFTLTGTRRGEDILAGEVLAFDVKAFDSGVPVIGVNGPDGIAGAGPGTSLGADGSDDVILTPNDPGYGAALAGTYTPMSYGSYVDLMWGRKTLCSLPYYGLHYGSISGTTTPNLWTELSGLRSVTSPPTNAPTLTYSDGLRRSGKALDASTFSILQPTFDTWTTRYESDGLIQAQMSGFNGIANIDALKRMNNKGAAGSDAASTGWRQSAKDAGTDGIDNDGTRGVDDAAEGETLPPFPGKLRGIKVSVRIEDSATRLIKQMSVANEFVTQ